MQPIRQVVGRARRRLRARAALEAGTAVVPLAAAAACAGAGPPVWGAIVASGALVAAAWPRDDEAIARRVDRASGLADRLSTAIAFARGLSTRDPVTRTLADLAIADAIRAAPRADVRAAVPIRPPRATRAAAASVMIAALFVTMPRDPPLEGVGRIGRLPAWVVTVPDHDRPVLGPDDLGYVIYLLDRVRRGASPQTVAWADAVEQRVVAASLGRLDRETLLEELEGLDVPGEVGPAGDDVIAAIRAAEPPPPPPPPAPPPPPPPGPDLGDDDRIGEDHDDDLTGPPTPKDEDVRDLRLRGQRGEGPSRRETLLSAAHQGFAGAEYRHVYAEYTDIVEEVMRTEQVPSTRRYLIQRYFHWIRPGER
jgi:hypothetical protein